MPNWVTGKMFFLNGFFSISGNGTELSFFEKGDRTNCHIGSPPKMDVKRFFLLLPKKASFKRKVFVSWKPRLHQNQVFRVPEKVTVN